jgi:hypothetical protein
MESLRKDLNNAASMVSPNGDADVLFIAKGSEFAIGGRVATAKENVTMTLENNATFEGDLQDLKDAMGVSAENVIKAFVDLSNDFIGYIDDAEVNYLTINIGEQPLQPEEAEAPVTGEWISIRSGLQEGYVYTVCLPYAVKNYRGGIFFRINNKNGSNLELISVSELAAGVPYIFKPNSGSNEVEGFVVDNTFAPAALSSNGLIGTFENIKIAAYSADNQYYIFKNDGIVRSGNPCFIAANRAYIDMNAISEEPVVANAPGRVRMTIGANDAPTAIDEIAAETVEGTKKMMIDGQLIIVRDGVMYNAQGAVVK